MKLQSLGEENIMTVTPYLDQTGKRMMIYRFGNWKPSKTPVDEIFKATLIVLEIGIMEPRAQVNGGVGIFDLSNLTLSHTFHMSPSVAQKMISIIVVSIKITFLQEKKINLFCRHHFHTARRLFTSSIKVGSSTSHLLSLSHFSMTACAKICFSMAQITNHCTNTSTPKISQNVTAV